MTTAIHHQGGGNATLTERHPRLMVGVVLVALVLAGGLTGLAVGRLLAHVAQLLLGTVSPGM